MKKTFKITGMHCNSCSQNIEGELEDKVNNVKASYSKEEAIVDFDPSKISEKEIIKTIEKLGYKVISSKENLKNSKEKKDYLPGIITIFGIIILLAIFYFLLLPKIKLPEIGIPEPGTNSSLILLIIIGFFTGFHCIAMCGGFILSYTTKNAVKGYRGYLQHFVYGGSKVLSYTIIGAIFGLIGGVFAFSVGLRGTIAILAGIFMIFYALSMFGFAFFRRFQFNPKFLTKFSKKAGENAKGKFTMPMVTGLLNGLFIACGPLQAMYIYAAGTGSPITGAISLAAFGLGTLPLLLIFGTVATTISHTTTKRILQVSAIIVLILGLILINEGLTLVGSPYSFNTIKANIIGQNLSSSQVQNGYQIVNMDVDASGYHPDTFSIKTGIPVKWNINVKELTSCNSELLYKDYNIDIKLKQGLNTVEFTPTKDGVSPFNCWMGMLHGNFIISKSGTATNEQLATVKTTSGSGATCNMGSGGSCGCGMMK